jgi:tetratricopeptide (TPR) repeat protein
MRRGPQVFISYAREASGREARDLYDLLLAAGIEAFLDVRDERPGDSIPERVFDALLDSQVVVILLSATYFTRRYCVAELTTALHPYRALAGGEGSRHGAEDALLPIVIGLPADGEPLWDLELLPPGLRGRNWLSANDGDRLAGLVRDRLGLVHSTLRGRLERLGELTALLERFDEGMAIPLPRRPGSVPLYHETGIPSSIGDGFIGRSQELWALHEMLAARQGSAAMLTTVLEGGGGFGKTRLALEYVHRYGPQEYPAGLFWVNADVPEDRLEAQQHAILSLIRPGVPSLEAFRESRRDVARELGEALRDAARDGHILYVVDNVPEPSGDGQLSPLSRWCPGERHVSLLVTSRARHTLVGGARRLELRELSTAAAVRLIRHDFIGRAALPDEGWQRIAAWVGEWPLALELLNAALRAGAISPAELLAAVDAGSPARELERQMSALKGSVTDGSLRGVAEALAISYHRLPESARSEVTRLAWLAPDPIPVELISEMDARVRVLLRARSFVAEVQSGAVEMYGRIHGVLADYLRQATNHRATDLSAASASLLSVMTWDACADPLSWPLLNACRPHGEMVLQRGAAEAEVEADELLAERLVTLGRVICRLLRRQGQLAASAERGAACVELARRCLGEDHEQTLNAMGTLAWTLRASGEFRRAMELQEAVLRYRTAELGGEHVDTLTAMSSLASTLAALGELDRARELLERVVSLRRIRLGPAHPETLLATAELAGTLHERGDDASARRVVSELDATLPAADMADEGVLWALGQLTSVLGALGAVDRAVALTQTVLNARRRLLGESHMETLRDLGQLASLLRAKGELGQAGEYARRVLEERRRVLGPEHPDTIWAMVELATTLRALGDERSAADLDRGAREAISRILGTEPGDRLPADELMLQPRGHGQQFIAAGRRLFDSGAREPNPSPPGPPPGGGRREGRGAA